MILPNEVIVILAAITLAAAALLGLAVGRVAARVLRVPWSGRTGAADAALAAGSGMAAAFGLAALHADVSWGLGAILAAAALGVALRHIARRTRRPHVTGPAA